jgi:hypothetical protein
MRERLTALTSHCFPLSLPFLIPPTKHSVIEYSYKLGSDCCDRNISPGKQGTIYYKNVPLHARSGENFINASIKIFFSPKL